MIDETLTSEPCSGYHLPFGSTIAGQSSPDPNAPTIVHAADGYAFSMMSMIPARASSDRFGHASTTRRIPAFSGPALNV